MYNNNNNILGFRTLTLNSAAVETVDNLFNLQPSAASSLCLSTVWFFIKKTATTNKKKKKKIFNLFSIYVSMLHHAGVPLLRSFVRSFVRSFQVDRLRTENGELSCNDILDDHPRPYQRLEATILIQFPFCLLN